MINNIDWVKYFNDKLDLSYSNFQLELLKKFYNEYLSINSGGRNNGMSFKYPYKPYLMVCIAKTMNVNSIKINDDFLLLFKNYLVKDPYMCEKYDDISEWSLKKIKGWIYKNPMSKNRKPYIFTFDNQNDLITLNESFTMDNNFKILLVNLANVRLNACTNVEIKDESCLDNLDKLYERTEYILGEFRRTGSWRNIILSKLRKCMFCDANLPLQAAHIAPFKFFNSDCDNEYNGIVLCANCHFIFDKYLILKKDGEQYRFYIKKSIDENVKRELNKKLQGYSEQVNSLVKKEPRYKQYFDKLVDLNRERYANI